jgi:hypothetical protein
MPKQGYITVARTDNRNDCREAWLAAKSIKKFDPDREVCVVVDNIDKFPNDLESVFDYVVQLPYDAYDIHEDFKTNIWQIYYCTPFFENIYFDKQTLLLSNIDGVWDNCSTHDLVFPSKVTNFKQENLDFLYYFKTHQKNKLPTVFTDFFYFKKSENSAEFFKMLDPILKNWRSIYTNFANENKPEYFNINLLINITIKLLGYENPNTDFFTYNFLSLENITLDDKDLPDDWTKYLSCWVKNSTVKINNHKLTQLVYYNTPNFIDEEILNEF